MRKYHKEYTTGLYGVFNQIMYDTRYVFIPAAKTALTPISFILAGILAFHYCCFGTVLPSRENSNKVNNETVVDSIPDSLFIPKPNPLEKRLE